MFVRPAHPNNSPVLSEGNILPSRAFCSDENQLYPILEITKHFGTPPFDHGRVSGLLTELST
jgi:hypothetical protein